MPAHKLTDQQRAISRAARFWSKVDRRDDGQCWMWLARRAKRYGYGELFDRRGRPPLKAHRVSYELNVGPIPAGCAVLHTCDNPACVNPAHLRVGSQLDNIADMVRKDRHNPYGRRTLGGKQ